jgi:hypothetical protein
MKEFLHEKEQMHRQPDHGYAALYLGQIATLLIANYLYLAGGEALFYS